MSDQIGLIYICPNCARPTFFDPANDPVPSPRLGEAVASLPDDVRHAYDEARVCTAFGAYTAAVMMCRKLLMHVAVHKGAATGQKFVEYVTYLDGKGYIPPDGKGWVDRIRDLGNVANHELPRMKQADAKDALDFVGMLLKFVYEFARRAPKPKSTKR